MEDEKNYSEMLRKRKLKSTRHRTSIIAELEESQVPMTAEDIFIRLRGKNISISMSTVYRVLDTLGEKGLVVQSTLPGVNKAVYEINKKEHHHHLVCVKCRNMFSVEGCPVEEYEKALEGRFGFSVKGHKLEIYGYCSECKESN